MKKGVYNRLIQTNRARVRAVKIALRKISRKIKAKKLKS
jgi:hypothetical protein